MPHRNEAEREDDCRFRDSFPDSSMPAPSFRSRVRGCLLGGALGDALGADIEFLSHDEIVARHGPDGPDHLGSGYGVLGAITDDTQMTLWTAEGSLRAYRRGASRGIVSVPGVVLRAYFRWLGTQGEAPDKLAARTSWLYAIEALHARRAPGMTCLGALRAWSQKGPNDPEPTNTSKGCGGVMRMAPVGLLSDRPGVAFDLGCKIAKLTHGHPTGIIASGAFAVAIWHLAEGADLGTALAHARQSAAEAEGGEETVDALDRAQSLATGTLSDADAVHALGTVTPDAGPGWVAEEALAVAALCARRYPSDPERALRMAVTHTGDSDSTGAICGNLLGAALGVDALPARWVGAVELRDAILQVADDLHDARTVQVDWYYGPKGTGWYDRYPPG